MLPPNDFFIKLPIADGTPEMKTSLVVVMIHQYREVSGFFQEQS